VPVSFLLLEVMSGNKPVHHHLWSETINLFVFRFLEGVDETTASAGLETMRYGTFGFGHGFPRMIVCPTFYLPILECRAQREYKNSGLIVIG
jgi:hypothetical protein